MEKIFEGRTEQEAVELAAKEFGVSREYMDIEVVHKSKKGLFGLSGKVSIKVTVEGLPQGEHGHDYEDEPFQSSQRDTNNSYENNYVEEDEVYPLNEETKKVAKETIETIISKMGIKIRDVIFTDDSQYIDIDIEDLEDQNILIGKFGKNIEALQLLLNSILQSKLEESQRVVVDIEGYRQKRTDWIKSVAIKKAKYVQRSGKSFLMDNFGPYDRRQIHTAVRGIDGVETKSEGNGYLKRVRIFSV